MILKGREAIFGRKVALPPHDPSFDFAIPDDGSLPSGGALPSIIDRRGKPRSMTTIADLGARLRSFSLQHPGAEAISTLLQEIGIDRPPTMKHGPDLRYRAQIDTPTGPKELY